MSQLYQLSYISRSLIKGSDESIKQQVEAILNSSQKNNPALGVTGALLYSGGYFCQILEGPIKPLVDLYAKINQDERHTGITLLHFHESDSRIFKHWSMAFAGIQDKLHFHIDDIKDSTDDLSMEEKGKELVSFLDDLVRKHQAKHERSAIAK